MALLFHSLFVCVAVASSDDQSLMQHGVGLDTRQTQSTGHALAISAVQDALKSHQFPGKMRQMAIDALVRSVSSSSESQTPPVDVDATYDQIITLLDSLRDTFHTERDTENTELETLKTRMTTCNTNYATSSDSHRETFENDRDDAIDCIKDEFYNFSKVVDPCNTIQFDLGSLDNSFCEEFKAEVSARVADSYARYSEVWDWAGGARFSGHYHVSELVASSMTAVGAWTRITGPEVHDKYKGYAGHVSPTGVVTTCNDGHALMNNLRDNCLAKEDLAKGHWCQLMFDMQVECASHTTCYDDAKRDYDARLATAVLMGVNWMRGRNVIIHVKCIVNEILRDGSVVMQIESQADLDIRCPDHWPAALSAPPAGPEYDEIVSHNITEPTIPAMSVCDAIPSPAPGDATWATVTFGDLDLYRQQANMSADYPRVYRESTACA